MDRRMRERLERRGYVFDNGAGELPRLLGDGAGPRAFFKWFFYSVMRFDPAVYRKRYWREHFRTGAAEGPVPSTPGRFLDPSRNTYCKWVTNVNVFICAFGASLFMWCIVKLLQDYIKVLRRPTYYKEEREKRRRLAAERRRMRRRRTTCGKPTPEMLAGAFARAKDSPAAMIRFGSMLEDLECYVDNSVIWDPQIGRIVGRRGGIRAWLAENAPELFRRYKTVMRYKALSRQFRQASGIGDPVPASALLSQYGASEQNCAPAQPLSNPHSRQPAGEGGNSKRALEIARRRAAEIMSKCDGTLAGLAEEIALRILDGFIAKEKRAVPCSTHHG